MGRRGVGSAWIAEKRVGIAFFPVLKLHIAANSHFFPFRRNIPGLISNLSRPEASKSSQIAIFPRSGRYFPGFQAKFPVLKLLIASNSLLFPFGRNIPGF